MPGYRIAVGLVLGDLDETAVGFLLGEVVATELATDKVMGAVTGT